MCGKKGALVVSKGGLVAGILEPKLLHVIHRSRDKDEECVKTGPSTPKSRSRSRSPV